MNVMELELGVDDHVVIASADTVKSLSTDDIGLATDAVKARQALITTETNSIRVTFDGTDPSRTGPVGHLVEAGSVISISDYGTIARMKFTSATAGQAASLQVSLSKGR